MRLTAQRFERLQRSLDIALNQEWPKLGATKRRLLKVKPIWIEKTCGEAALNAIAMVATDGGENCLSLAPMQLQVIRVADSLGTVYFEEFIAQSLEPQEILRFFFKSEERLQRFIACLDLEWEELLPRTDLQRSNLLSMMRELMEWAALLKLASQPGAKLLIRDGLLRSILLSERVFSRLRRQFERLTRKHGHLLVGVAKRSRVITYLSAAIELGEEFPANAPAYMRVPADLEREAAPAQYRWIGNRAMGDLSVARLDMEKGTPLMPIDIAHWQEERTSEAMSLLHQCSRGSFPARGYPQPLIQAHEHAKIGGIESEMLENLLLEGIRDRSPHAANVARQLRLTGQALAQGAQKGSELEG
jgi:hypothetical protein